MLKTLITTAITTAIMAVALGGCSNSSNSNDVKPQADPIDLVASNSVAFETYNAEEFYKTTSVFGSSINHLGNAVLVSNDKSGIFNAYRVPVDGSPSKQLTFSTKESVFVESWFPKDERFLYSADKGGDELNHLYVQELDGTDVDLTPGEGLKASVMSWHEDEQSFFVVTNERDAKYFDVYQYNTEDYSRQLVFKNDSGFSVESVSPNGRFIALSKSHSNSNSDLYLIDLRLKMAKPRLLTEHSGDVSYSVDTFSKDNKRLLYATDEFGEFNQSWAYDLATGESTLSYKADWDVSFSYFSKDGRFQITGVNADAQTQLIITDLTTNSELQLPTLPSGDLRGVNFSDDSSSMVFYINSDTSPSNLYTHKLGTDSILRLTNSGNPNIKEQNLVTGEVVRFKSFDGLDIPAILYKPKQANMKKVPALIYIHGGPGGQSRKGYSATVQHLVNNGYAIIKINNRGSSGYGKTFFHLDDKRHGEDDLQDVVYNKKYLQTLDWVDADKIGVMGGSYGGYLTMAAMAFTDEFKVGINIFGVTNWVRTLESIPPYWEAFRKSLYDELGDPTTDKERLHNISPVFFGEQVKSPVLVVQGANDPRVLKIESDEMVESIRSGGTYVDYLVFDDEGHGFSKKANRISASNKYLEFLNTYL
ncbi:S9 family peptidase [Shewanella sp. 10N.286.48.B5]|uniref:S9 family peptidase n=1 Tax=Shewanella sp. 10N.286.48.B5 TaxID=1880834 RepID=UPI000C83216B|nr:S9 family peptidase [Shewanella sp. 10N.286.48.B5]PMH87852.1 peptidase S9 [Shewanella sp. 10N.286.48.B5]